MKVNVTKDTVIITEYSPVNAGERGLNICEFHLPEEFSSLTVTAAFNNIPVPVCDGECVIPTLKKGTAILGVYAYKESSDGVELMYSPKPTAFYVNEGSYTEEVAIEENPSITEYEKYCQLFTASLMEKVNDREKVANNNFSNAVKGVRSGCVVRIDDVSPIEHTLKINLQGDLVTETTAVYRYGKNLFPVNEYKVKSTQPWGANRVGDIDIRAGKYVASCNFKQVGTDKSEVSLSIRNKDDVTQIIKTVKSTDVEGSLICPFDVSEDMNGVVVYLYSNTTADVLSTECDFTYIQIEAGENATDFELYKGVETYTPDKNGDLIIKSISPTMTLTTNNDEILNCEYNKDINKCINQNTQAIDILTGVNASEEHTNEQVYGALAVDEVLYDIAEVLERKQDKIKNKVFEKIATVTVSPDTDGSLPTKISITADDDGNPFELTDIYCDCYIGLTDGSKGRFYITGSGLSLMGNFSVGFDTTPKYWSFRCDSYGEGNGGLTTAAEYAMGSKAIPNANYYKLLGQFIPPGKTLNFKSVEFIGQVGTTKTFIEGTTITLWGVRK